MAITLVSRWSHQRDCEYRPALGYPHLEITRNGEPLFWKDANNDAASSLSSHRD
jgi:hypothetical protein